MPSQYCQAEMTRCFAPYLYGTASQLLQESLCYIDGQLSYLSSSCVSRTADRPTSETNTLEARLDIM